jgi:hypothetical protein
MERNEELRALRLEIQKKAERINKNVVRNRFAKDAKIKVVEAVREPDKDTCLVEAESGSVITAPKGLLSLTVIKGSVQTSNGRIVEGQSYDVDRHEELRIAAESKVFMNWTPRSRR